MQEAKALNRERLFVLAFLLCVVIFVMRAVHSGWLEFVVAASQLNVSNPQTQNPMSYAPNAYRVAMPALQAGLMRLVHTENSSAVFAAMDGFFLLPTLYLGYLLTVESLAAASRQRAVAVALFLAFLQFPIAWITPWQRPETTPTALYVMLVLFCVSRMRQSRRWFGVILAATLAQGFVRSDVPVVAGLSIMALGAAGSLHQLGSRGANILRGAAVAALGAGVQAYLQLVRFPHLPYPPGTSVVQLALNLQPSNILAFVAATLPFLGLAAFLMARKPPLREIDKLALVTTVLYVPLLCVVAVLREVRLLVPLLIALCVVAARTLAWMSVQPEP